MSVVLRLTLMQLTMYLRDRQSVFLSLFFPLMMMFALGYMVNSDVNPPAIALVGNTEAAPELAASLLDSKLIAVSQTGINEARDALRNDRVTLILELSESDPAPGAPVTLKALVNAGNPNGTAQTLALLRGTLHDLEYGIRGDAPLFSIETEDVLARHLRYVDFLIPGILAFMVMQLAIAGSGFNIVEYKRKGILKRLFVTPLRPLDFVVSLIASRLVTILVQLSVLLGVALLAFGIAIEGNLLLLFAFVIAGAIMFLGIGFALGGIASTQNAIIMIGNLVIFPQTFLAGVFFPLDALPGWMQTAAGLLPLTFVSHAVRAIANEGAGVADLGWDLAGIAAWTAIGLFLAVRFFRWSDAANS
ncbi:MAG: ABC transporter permease [Alphaproteobacteria bacterium]|nr:ABC transporter permease [Alphaproteobacteria bacterium]